MCKGPEAEKILIMVKELREDLSDWSCMGKERGTEEACGEGRGQFMLRLISLGFILRKLGSLDLSFKSFPRLRCGA